MGRVCGLLGVNCYKNLFFLDLSKDFGFGAAMVVEDMVIIGDLHGDTTN